MNMNMSISRRSQSNTIERSANRTQSNAIIRLNSIVFGNRTKSNSQKFLRNSIAFDWSCNSSYEELTISHATEIFTTTQLMLLILLFIVNGC